MKHSLILFCLTVTSFFFAQNVTFTASKRLVVPVLNSEVKPENIVELVNTSKLTSKGAKTYTWTVNGSVEPGKGWDFVKGTNKNAEKIKITFNKLGNYTIGLNIVEKNGEEENEYSAEMEDLISVRSVFPELAALYAQKPKPNYVKLVEKASEYVAKPKFANDPTPNLFLSKGFLGLVKTGNSDPRFESAFEDAVASFAAAKELDKNGVIYDDEHQKYLSELETYLLTENIEVFVDEDSKNSDAMDQLAEAVDFYSQVTLAPIASKFLEAYLKFNMKDTKGANLIFTTEIPKLKKYKKLDEETPYGEKFTDENGTEFIMSTVDLKVLKMGVKKVALLMKTRDGGKPFKACELLEAVEPWLIDDKDFASFYSTEFKSCSEK